MDATETTAAPTKLMQLRRHRITGSKVWLAALCRYWARADVEPSLEPDSPPLRIGSAFHESAEIHPMPGVDEAFHEATGLAGAVDLEALALKWNLRPSEAETVADMYGAWKLWLPSYLDGRRDFVREAALAWDTAAWTGRLLPRAAHRDYSACTATEIPCTTDLVVFGDELEVIDYKTGLLPVKAEGHAQLAICGLAAAHTWGAKKVRVTIARVRPESVTTSSVVLSAKDMDATAVELDYYVLSVPSAEPAPGMHCGMCPSAASCPETHALVDELRLEVPELAGLFLGPPRTPEQAARLKLALKPLEAVLDDLKLRAAAWAEAHDGIILPDGSKVRRVEIPVRKINPASAALRALLTERYGADAVERVLVVKESMSVAAVGHLAREGAPRGKKDAAEKELFSAIEGTGALTISKQTRWTDDD